jgi:hypothetical protein
VSKGGFPHWQPEKQADFSDRSVKTDLEGGTGLAMSKRMERPKVRWYLSAKKEWTVSKRKFEEKREMYLYLY